MNAVRWPPGALQIKIVGENARNVTGRSKDKCFLNHLRGGGHDFSNMTGTGGWNRRKTFEL